MKLIMIGILLSSMILHGASRWETVHYEMTDNGFLDASAPDSMVGVLCGIRDNVGSIIYKTTNGGTSWQEYQPWTIEQCMFVFGMHFPNQNTGYVSGMGLLYSLLPVAVLYKTTDCGNTWTNTYGLTIDFLGILWEDVFFTDLSNGWLAGPSSDIRHTTNGGTNWTIQTAPDTGYSLQGIHFINPNEGWIVGGEYDSITGQGQNGVVLHTTNGGTNWSAQVSNGPWQLWDIRFVDNMNGWACGYKDSASPGVFLRTTDGGNNWTEVLAPTVSLGPYGLYSLDFPEPLTGFAAGGGNRSGWQGSYFGAFLKTTDGGDNWAVDTVIFDNDPWGVSPLGMDMFNSRWGYAGGARLSAFKYTPGIVSIAENETRTPPTLFPQSMFSLNQGIAIDLAEKHGYAKIAVYDVLGRQVFEISPVTSSHIELAAPSRGNYFIVYFGKKGGTRVNKITVY